MTARGWSAIDFPTRGIAFTLALLLASCAPENDGTLAGYVEADLIYLAPQDAGVVRTLNIREGDTVRIAFDPRTDPSLAKRTVDVYLIEHEDLLAHLTGRKLRSVLGRPLTLKLGQEGVQENTFVLDTVLGRELIPVLAPVAAGANGATFNVNADTFAGAIAGALKAKRFLLLTDVPGVLDKSKQLIKELSAADVRKLIADGTISGGMIPKVETCLYALEQGVEGVVILDGKVPHAVLLELFTDHGAGTLIHR